MLLRLVVVCGASHGVPVMPNGGVTDGIRAGPSPVNVWFEDEPSGSGGPCDIRSGIRTDSCESGCGVQERFEPHIEMGERWG